MTVMNLSEQAETFRLLLLMGLASKAQIIAWADDLIMKLEHPPGWLLDLSIAANDSDAAIASRLREIPFEGDRLIAAYSALDRFAEEFRDGTSRTATLAFALQCWASHTDLNDHDRMRTRVAADIAQDYELGYASENNVLDAIDRCLAHVAARRAK